MRNVKKKRVYFRTSLRSRASRRLWWLIDEQRFVRIFRYKPGISPWCDYRAFSTVPEDYYIPRETWKCTCRLYTRIYDGSAACMGLRARLSFSFSEGKKWIFMRLRLHTT